MVFCLLLCKMVCNNIDSAPLSILWSLYSVSCECACTVHGCDGFEFSRHLYLNYRMLTKTMAMFHRL